MATYRINEAYTTNNRQIEAASFATVGDFVDFYDGHGEVILRLRAQDVFTIERKDG